MRSAEGVEAVCRCLAVAMLFALLVPVAAAAGESVGPAPVAVGAGAPEPKTLKEKLSDKASDEQRVDNCHVPPGERGTKPRPDCAPRLSGPSAKSD
jgi:hypothetical protein